MKKYELPVLLKLCATIREDATARQWLMENEFRELIEFWDASEHVEKSYKWLLENNHRELAALADGLHGDDKAKVFLIRSGHQELAVFIDAAEGNKTAIDWLIKFNHKHWLAVAIEIYQWNKKNEPKGFWSIFNIGNPFK